jgi:hypothetical protein
LNPDKSIIEFLCRDENLSLAIEVADAIDAVDEHIELRFLNLMHETLSKRFKLSSMDRLWKLEMEVEQASKTRRYAGVYISPRNNSPRNYLLYSLIVCRESSEYTLYYGLEWGGKSNEQPAGFPTDESTPLVAFLEDREFDGSKWTLGWKIVGSFMNRKELLLALHQRGKELSATAVNDFWAFVESTTEMVTKTNASLERPDKGT